MIALSQIREAVAEALGIEPAMFDSQRRDKLHANARALAWWLARDLTAHSFPTIARHIGKRDHSTVLSGIARHESRMLDDPDVKALTLRLRDKLKQGDDGTIDFVQALADEALPQLAVAPTRVRLGEFAKACRVIGKRIEIVDAADPPYHRLLAFWNENAGRRSAS